MLICRLTDAGALFGDRVYSRPAFLRQVFLRLALLFFLTAAAWPATALYPSPALAASPAIFKTSEYFSMGSLDQIKAADAYALGFTGKGVTVAVIDSGMSWSHQEFRDKYPHLTEYFINPKDQEHGIHVSATIAASKNNLGMHGVAFDANLLSLVAIDGDSLSPDPDDDPIENALNSLLRYPDVRIVNNSWGDDGIVSTLSHYSSWSRDFRDEALDLGQTIAGIVSQKDVLFVFAAGNEGSPSPGMSPALASFLLGTKLAVVLDGGANVILDNGDTLGAQLKNNMISVSAYDAQAMALFGTNSPAFVYSRSNMADGAGEYSIMAPGAWINAAVDKGDASYEALAGTSMAAPHVSGAAALVSQAFPYMGGKQLADVILSTATPLDISSAPPFFVLFQDDGNFTEAVYTADPNIDASALIGRDEELKAIWRAAYLEYPDDNELNDFRALIGALLDNPNDPNRHVLSEADYLRLFGVGLLDAGKAVRGPGCLDAKRLGDTDLAHIDSGAYAMYGVDSKGYNSIWSNDIKQRAADAGVLNNLDVGLHKQGEGTLYLTGNNSYAGPTLVEGGAISLGIDLAGQSLTGSLAGGVHVDQAGLFTGAGTVGKNIVNQGLLLPGHNSLAGTELKVGGDVKNSGALLFTLGQNGRANRLFVTGDVDLSGSSAIDIISSSSEVIEPYQDFGVVLSSGGTISYPVGMADRIDYSAFMSFFVDRGLQSMSFRGMTRNLDTLPDVPARTQAVASALQHLFDSLKGSPLQDQLDFLYSAKRGEFLDAAAAYRGDVQAATLTRLPFTDVLNRIVVANPLGKKAAPGSEDLTPEEFSPQLGKPGPRFWLRPVMAYNRVDGQDDIGQRVTGTHMRGLVIGAQQDMENDLYGGILLAFGDNDIRQGSGRASITDVRAGLYGGWTLGGFSLGGVVSGGWQHYKVKRDVPVSDGQDRLSSRFDGMSFGLGLEGSYNLLHSFSDAAALAPYVGYDLDYVYQQERTESGNEVFALSIDSDDLWRSVLRTGLKADFSPLEWLTLSASGGYKRLIDGHRPGLSAGFKLDSSYKFEAVGPDMGRDFATFEIGAEAQLPHQVSLSARFFGENSSRSRTYGGYANVAVAF